MRNRKKKIKKYLPFFLALLLSGCAKQTQTDTLEITIPEYEKIIYTTESVKYGDIVPVLELRLKAEDFERKDYYPDHDEMEVAEVHVNVGDIVTSGDELITFSSEEIEQERSQYEKRVEEDALLIDHYTRLAEINQTDEYESSISDLRKDQELANLYIAELDARLDAYTIKAEGNGVVSSLSDLLNYGMVFSDTSVVTIMYGLDNYIVVTEDDYDFQVGQTFTATFGVGKYEVVLENVEELATDTDAGNKRKLTFKLADPMKRPNGDSLNLKIEKEVLKNVLYVPKEAVVYANGTYYVYVVDEEGYRHGVEVEIGSTVEDYTVIEAGLQEGDKVVVK